VAAVRFRAGRKKAGPRPQKYVDASVSFGANHTLEDPSTTQQYPDPGGTAAKRPRTTHPEMAGGNAGAGADANASEVAADRDHCGRRRG
jgi:hypothetical protein